MILLVLGVILALVLFAVDRHLCLKDIEKDIRLYLGDVLVARDSAPEELKVHFAAQVNVLKLLIRTHFGKL